MSRDCTPSSATRTPQPRRTACAGWSGERARARGGPAPSVLRPPRTQEHRPRGIRQAVRDADPGARQRRRWIARRRARDRARPEQPQHRGRAGARDAARHGLDDARRGRWRCAQSRPVRVGRSRGGAPARREDRRARRAVAGPGSDRLRDHGRVPDARAAERVAERDRRAPGRARRRGASSLSDIVVGIDAGASKTRAFAVDRAGTVVGRGAGGGGNLLTSPDPQGAIAAALAEALGGRGADAIVLSCAGGDRETERARGQEILARLAPPGAKLLVTHDAIAALYAGNPTGCGVVLIAGTGSIAYGRNEEGEEDRAGGWGYLIGDEGSAVWCGLEALRAVAHTVDGRGTPTKLEALIFHELGVGEFGDVLPFVYGRPHPAPAIAAATRALAVASAEGDAIANGILQRGATSLARAAAVVALTLGLPGGPVYLSGGAFDNLPILQRLVRLELLGVLPQATVEPVREEPAMGAARIAMELAWSVAR